MKLIGKFVFQIFSNAVALFAASKLIPGFIFTGSIGELAVAALILTLINMTVRPVLKLFFGPVIVLTLGLFLIVVNALTLFILDIVSSPLTIQGYLPLLEASVLVSVVNFVIGVSGKLAFKS